MINEKHISIIKNVERLLKSDKRELLCIHVDSEDKYFICINLLKKIMSKDKAYNDLWDFESCDTELYNIYK